MFLPSHVGRQYRCRKLDRRDGFPSGVHSTNGCRWLSINSSSPLWVQPSAQFHQQGTWAGLIAATTACWYGTALHPRDLIWAQPLAPRLGLPAVAHHLTVLIS